MWTLKSIEATAEQNTTAFTASITYTNGKEDVTLASTRLSSRKELEDTVRVNQARLNERDEVLKEVTDGTFAVPEPEPPREPSAKEVAQREYDEALALFKDLSDKAEIDPTTFNWGRDNQRVIVQQKLQALMNAS